ncbi:phage portal protein family protein [Flavobacterium sp. XS2P14]|uniref:phage portal protein family protein n=1 Tax=Flavobacterium sp. XS2P14 TaxID=3401735 RepID=UPI003AAA3041
MAQGAKVGKTYENRPSNIILPKSKSLSVQTIKKWKDALTLAQLAENANRKPYIELCDSILLDSHLASVIESRVLKIKQSKFKLVDASGKSDAEISKLFEQPWFNSFIYHAIMAKFRGTTVVELWDLNPETMGLDNVNAIEQENILPLKGLIVKENGDETGYSYKEDPLKPYYIQIGKNKDLGILKDVAPDALTKKFAKASWAEFVEKYGIPPRWVTTDSYSESRENELADMMANMVSNHWAVLKGNEKIEVMNSSGASSYEIFDKLIDRMNSEMTKRILGQDGTTDANAKGTYGSLKVMQDVSDDRHDSDKTDIKDLINAELLWRLQLISPVYGVLKNYTFDWDDSKEMTPAEIVEMVGKLSTAGFEVDTKFITDKTGIPIVGLKQEPITQLATLESTQKKKSQKLQPVAFYRTKL